MAGTILFCNGAPNCGEVVEVTHYGVRCPNCGSKSFVLPNPKNKTHKKKVQEFLQNKEETQARERVILRA